MTSPGEAKAPTFPMASPPVEPPDLSSLFRVELARLWRFFSEKEAPQTARGPILVAVSGGADSMALATLFAQQCGNGHGACAWQLVHVQHRLRGLDSLEDERFLVESGPLWSRFPNPPASIVVLNGVPEGGWPAGSYEDAARLARYRALLQHAAAWNAAAICTAHTLDDQAETVLLRLFRGAGLAGLRAMRPVTTRSGTPILRPLLGVSRGALRAFLASQSIGWREDASNAQTQADRNFLRHNIIPLAQERWGDRVPRFLARLARQAGRWAEDRQRWLDRLIASWELPKAGNRVVWHLGKAKIKKTKVLADCLHRLWAREGWPAREWSDRRFRRLARFIRGKAALENLPQGWAIYLDEHVVRFDPPSSWTGRPSGRAD